MIINHRRRPGYGCVSLIIVFVYTSRHERIDSQFIALKIIGYCLRLGGRSQLSQMTTAMALHITHAVRTFAAKPIHATDKCCAVFVVEQWHIAFAAAMK